MLRICFLSDPWRVNQLGGRYVNGKPLPFEIRMQILYCARNGVRPCDISRQMKITHGCISKLLAKFKRTGSMAPGSVIPVKQAFLELKRNSENDNETTDNLSSSFQSTSCEVKESENRDAFSVEGKHDSEVSSSNHRLTSEISHSVEGRKGEFQHKPYNHSIDEILCTSNNGERSQTATSTERVMEISNIGRNDEITINYTTGIFMDKIKLR